jgi:hypothetical protein
MADDYDGGFGERISRYKKGGDGAGQVSHLTLQWAWEINLAGTSQTLVKGVLSKGSCSLWYGDTGTGKSFLALDLGLHVALCRDWFGRRVAQALVVYIATEAGGSMRRRIVAFFQHHGVSPEDVPFALIASPVNLLDASPDLPALIHEIKGARAKFPDLPPLIIIDTLSRALAGGNENMPDDMGAFIRHVDGLRNVTGAHVAIVHHSGKTPSQGARGHSLLRAAVDTEIEISRPEGSKQSVALVTKQRDEDTGASVAFRLHVVDLGYDDEGDPIASCVVEQIDGAAPQVPMKPKRKPPPIPPDYLRAVDFLRDAIVDHGEPLNKPGYPKLMATTLDHWRDHLKQRGLYDGDDVSRSWFRRAKERLIGDGLITVDVDLVWPAPRPSAVITPFPGP